MFITQYQYTNKYFFLEYQNSVLHIHSLPQNKGHVPFINKCIKPTDIKVNKSVKCRFLRLKTLVLHQIIVLPWEKSHFFPYHFDTLIHTETSEFLHVLVCVHMNEERFTTRCYILMIQLLSSDPSMVYLKSRTIHSIFQGVKVKSNIPTFKYLWHIEQVVPQY